ncbi:hypothetical protein QBC38DRAFT_477157 [Podospora fimiseda]|uniref:Fe2OG dioxygenase domain-containing protein n=1 Tax=Podospora fimiseda TaxID=252190 RepID=A0AAN7BQ82_9PEZI|nr:hypothetical protein QBC38DRAFT_477157 [Podospora fimiseda]
MDHNNNNNDLNLPSSLSSSKIPHLPPSAYYIPSFITPSEEQLLLQKVTTAPKARWRQLSHRRLQTWPSDLVKNTLLTTQPLPEWLETPVVSRLLSISLSSSSEENIFTSSPHNRPNHVLINEYPPKTGIMPHKDGSAYHPVVCTISLGSAICLSLYKQKPDGGIDPEPVWRILQEPRSLLITTDELYSDYLHGIEAVDADVGLSESTVANWGLLRDTSVFEEARGVHERQTRISLTYRDVLKVSKLGDKLGPMFKGK